METNTHSSTNLFMVSASIVTYFPNLEVLEKLLELMEMSPIENIYIIDNSSSSRVKILSERLKKTEYIDTKTNLGYGKAHNIGIKKSQKQGHKYHIVINPDIFWEGDIITPMLRYLDAHDEVGLLMPKILYPNGDTQYLCKLLPSPYDLILRRFLPFKNIIQERNKNYELQWTGYNEIMEVPILSGCFMLLRNKTIQKVGGFDERFFIYGEDVDLCRRIGEEAKTIFYPHVNVFHAYERGSYHMNKLLWWHICSMVKYFNKWGWIKDKNRSIRNRECIEAIKNQHPVYEPVVERL